MTETELFVAIHVYAIVTNAHAAGHDFVYKSDARAALLEAIRAWARRDDVLQAERVEQLGAIGEAAAKQLKAAQYDLSLLFVTIDAVLGAVESGPFRRLRSVYNSVRQRHQEPPP